MPNKHTHLRSLAALCRSFGGKLAVVSQDAFDELCKGRYTTSGFSESPFTSAHGLHWRKRIVYTVRGREEIGSIIHEMGHAFADLKPPDDACEWSWFGWEIAVARKIGAGRVWSKQNATYQTDETGSNEWGRLTASERRAVVIDRLAHAKKLNVVDLDGTPKSLRQRQLR
jgi:hypothetical protein